MDYFQLFWWIFLISTQSCVIQGSSIFFILLMGHFPYFTSFRKVICMGKRKLWPAWVGWNNRSMDTKTGKFMMHTSYISGLKSLLVPPTLSRAPCLPSVLSKLGNTTWCKSSSWQILTHPQWGKMVNGVLTNTCLIWCVPGFIPVFVFVFFSIHTDLLLPSLFLLFSFRLFFLEWS